MVSTLFMAMLGGVAATATTAVATGGAPTAVGLAHAAPQGLQIALSHVPSASHAYSVLKEHAALYAGSGAAGTAAAGGATALKHGLQVGLGR